MRNSDKRSGLLTKVISLHKLFRDGEIPTLAQHEVNPGLDKSSRLNYIYFTLPVCLNFQRSSPAMWQSALNTFNDPETNYVFYPEKLVDRPLEEIRASLVKHKLGIQPNKHTDIWIRINNTLYKYYDSDPRLLLKEGEYDVVKILTNLQTGDKAKFPFLRGIKLSNYWLYILTHFTDLKLTNMNKLSIIPDTHIIQSTYHLGLTDKIETPEAVARVWEELLESSELSPVDMHAVLWNWSRNNFHPSV